MDSPARLVSAPREAGLTSLPSPGTCLCLLCEPGGGAFAPGTEGTLVRKKGLESERPGFDSELFLLPVMTLNKLFNVPCTSLSPSGEWVTARITRDRIGQLLT